MTTTIPDATRPPATHQPGSRPLIPPRPASYEYHWGRILGLVVLLAMLGGAGLYGYRHWSSPPTGVDAPLAQVPMETEPVVALQPGLPESIPEPFTLDEAETPVSNTEITEPSPAVGGKEVKPLWEEAMVGEELLPPLGGEQVTALPADSPESRDLTDVATAQPLMPGKESETPVYFIDEEILPESDLKEEVRSIPDSEEPAVVKSQVVEESPSIDPVVEPQLIEGEIEPRAETGHFVLQDLQSYAEGVKRFRLASSISNREPVGELSDIDFSNDGNTRVWAFSEVLNMRGQRLDYVWVYQDSEVARVRIRVGGNRWRNFSSKTVNRAMTGSWRVELQDDQGRQLASAAFLLEPAE